jgi:hypothetical protein
MEALLQLAEGDDQYLYDSQAPLWPFTHPLVQPRLMLVAPEHLGLAESQLGRK